MLIAIHGVKLYAHCYTWSDVLCSLLYMERRFMLKAIQGVKLYAHCFTWREVICSFLYME